MFIMQIRRRKNLQPSPKNWPEPNVQKNRSNKKKEKKNEIQVNKKKRKKKKKNGTTGVPLAEY